MGVWVWLGVAEVEGVCVSVWVGVAAPDAVVDGVAVALAVCVMLYVTDCVGVCVRVGDRVIDAVCDFDCDGVASALALPVCVALCVWLHVRVCDCVELCVGVAAWLRLNEGLDESDWDAVPDWLGLPVAVCEALGAHVCWIAESRTARKDASAAHVAPLFKDTRLAKVAAPPLAGSTPLEVDPCRFMGGAQERARARLGLDTEAEKTRPLRGSVR